MAGSESIVGSVSKNNNRLKELMRVLVFFAIVMVVVAGSYGIWNRYFNAANKKATIPAPASPSRVEASLNNSVNKYLDNKDYDNYQNAQTVLAKQYLENNDPTNAIRVMSEVFKNVPSDKVKSSGYIVMVSAEKAVNDTQQYKHYLQLLIPKLKAEDSQRLAQDYQKNLDEAK